MANLNSISPFYVGQKVVCIKGVDELKEGREYIVKKVFRASCCSVWIVDVGISIPFPRLCANCWQWTSPYEGYRYSRFAPLQQTNFPLMSFSKIVEKEKTEILVNN
jgi:hypothetical protein